MSLLLNPFSVNDNVISPNHAIQLNQSNIDIFVTFLMSFSCVLGLLTCKLNSKGLVLDCKLVNALYKSSNCCGITEMALWREF